MMTRTAYTNGTKCDVCGSVYAQLDKWQRNPSEYAAAAQTIMRCLHAFVAYAISMFSFCCFYALNHSMPLDEDTFNTGVMIVVLLVVGTLIHLYQFMTCQIPCNPDKWQAVLQGFIQSCDKVEMTSTECVAEKMMANV